MELDSYNVVLLAKVGAIPTSTCLINKLMFRKIIKLPIYQVVEKVSESVLPTFSVKNKKENCSMIKKTNKVTANKVILDVDETNTIIVHEFDKEGNETIKPFIELIEDFIGKDSVNFSLVYDVNC